ncbi:hypothetical protein [Mammaliicoccus sciuri]|uniref:hypothetical protein n=1 Tax=Mammaliicoccus sciuri TaxID=1296 RepID=UPI0027379D01|nr:hypothetical protein [Mammaliicoccus sciuri]
MYKYELRNDKLLAINYRYTMMGGLELSDVEEYDLDEDTKLKYKVIMLIHSLNENIYVPIKDIYVKSEDNSVYMVVQVNIKCYPGEISVALDVTSDDKLNHSFENQKVYILNSLFDELYETHHEKIKKDHLRVLSEE